MIYSENKMSLTSDLSNEILYENPNKFIIIAREKSGEMKCSLRSTRYKVLPLLKKAERITHGADEESYKVFHDLKSVRACPGKTKKASQRPALFGFARRTLKL